MQDSRDPQASVPKNVGAFLNELRGESFLLRLEPYEPWMSMRSHRELL